MARKNKAGEYFLDRNPDIFALILYYYNTKKIKLLKVRNGKGGK
jgi:hypothetical protein